MQIRTFILLALFIIALGCSNSKRLNYQGYVEGELTFLASPYSGALVDLYVSRGQRVKKGQLLFKLDDNPEAIMVKASDAELSEAKRLYLDLRNPKRTPEIDALNAQIEQTEAQLALAKIRVQRYRQLYEKNAASKDTFDEVLAHSDELENLKKRYESNLELAKQGSRGEQINAQQAKIDALIAKLAQAKWQLSQKSIYAPADGMIFDTYFRVGEFVNNKQAVLSLLTPNNIRIEFFVPAEGLAALHMGEKILFTCDGCNKENQATINYISPVVEYMPPLVYSRDNNDKLVFRVKAAINNSREFKPGQPVIVTGIADAQ